MGLIYYLANEALKKKLNARSHGAALCESIKIFRFGEKNVTNVAERHLFPAE